MIKGVKKDQVRRGFILAAPGFMKAFKAFTAKVYVLSKNEGGRKTPFTTHFKPQFFFRTANITGTIVLDDSVLIVMPGDSVVFKVSLIEYCPLNVGLQFVFRESQSTVGAGVITELLEEDIL